MEAVAAEIRAADAGCVAQGGAHLPQLRAVLPGRAGDLNGKARKDLGRADRGRGGQGQGRRAGGKCGGHIRDGQGGGHPLGPDIARAMRVADAFEHGHMQAGRRQKGKCLGHRARHQCLLRGDQRVMGGRRRRDMADECIAGKGQHRARGGELLPDRRGLRPGRQSACHPVQRFPFPGHAITRARAAAMAAAAVRLLVVCASKRCTAACGTVSVAGSPAAKRRFSSLCTVTGRSSCRKW